MLKSEIAFDDFLKISIHAGTVIDAQEFSRAKNPSYRLWVDFGELGIKQTSAQVTKLYQLADLKGMQVLGLLNIPPRNIAGFMSEFLLLGLSDELGNIVLVQPERAVPNGSLLK